MKVSDIRMANAVVTAAADAARLIAENRLTVESLTIESTLGDVTTGNAAVSVAVGQRPRAVLDWARFLGADVVHTDRRVDDVTLRIEVIKDGIAWHVLGSYHKSLTGNVRNRFPGITVDWERREVSGTPSARGRISAAQLEVLIGRLGV